VEMLCVPMVETIGNVLIMVENLLFKQLNNIELKLETIHFLSSFQSAKGLP